MNTVTRTQGRYYWNKSDEQACYYFQFREDAPKSLRHNFIIELGNDYGWTGSPYEVAKEIMEAWEGYLYAPFMIEIQEVVSYLEKWNKQDKIDALIQEQGELCKRLEEIVDELSALESSGD